jgi:hypothetical protein
MHMSLAPHVPWPLQAFGHSAIAVEARPAANSKYLDIVNEFFYQQKETIKDFENL